jgi:ferric-dicitrate binding protein FerR (iron transport regulator)
MFLRRMLACVLAILLIAEALPARPAPAVVLGVVTQCASAHVGVVKLSEGSTIYDGDLLTTESAGSLQLRATGMQLRLMPDTAVSLRSSARGIEVDLFRGTVSLSAAQDRTFAISALQARIEAAGASPALAQVSILDRRRLGILARRGALQFAYADQSVVLPEGASVHIVLDPTRAERAAAHELADTADNSPEPDASPHRHARFLIIAVAIAIATGVVVYRTTHSPESPDRP